MKNLTVAEIRQLYPSPIRDSGMTTTAGAYCVGMACLLAYDRWDDADVFPGEYEIASVLADINPALDRPGPEYVGDEHDLSLENTLAYAFAWEITTDNDAGNFEGAWETLGRALTYRLEI